MKMTLKALGNRIIVKPEKVEDCKVTDAGVKLYFAQQTIAAERGAMDRGTVVAVGEFAWDDYAGPWAKVGDKVMWPKYGGRHVEIDDEDYWILNCADVMCGYEEVDDAPEETGSASKERDWDAEARGMGWNDSYDGEDRIDAREYVLRKPIFDELKKLRRKARDLDTALVSQKQVQDRLLAAERKEHDKQIRELKNAKMKAVEEGDTKAVVELDDEIDNLKTQEPTPQAQPSPEWNAWVENNQWYEDDQDMKLYAEAAAQQIHTGNRNLTATQVLEEVSARVMKTFPHKFKNPKREKDPNVESSNPTGKKTQQQSSSLTQEQKNVARTQWRAGLFGNPNKITFKQAQKEYEDELRKAGYFDDE
jgi:co-chaperonin GroES (HSP10)